MAIMLGLLVIVAFYAFDKAYRVPRVFLVFLLAAGTLRFGGNVGDIFGGSTNHSAIWPLCLILRGLVAALRGGAKCPTPTNGPRASMYWVTASLNPTRFFGSFLETMYPSRHSRCSAWMPSLAAATSARLFLDAWAACRKAWPVP